MAIPNLTPEIGYAAIKLIDANHPPSHDELTRLFGQAKLSAGDPGSAQGKVKRMRSVIDYALAENRPAGARLVSRLIAATRATGGFRSDSENYIGEDTFCNLRDAFRAKGFELSSDGELRPTLLDNVPEAEKHEVLGTYVRRIREGSSDAPLVTGSGKDLLEATAQTILHSKGTPYSGHDFPGILFHAFDALNLPTPEIPAMEAFRQKLSNDPGERVRQVLYLLGCEINKLRNAQGIGHGRAFLATVSDQEAKTAAQAMALISELLLAES
jgi:Abortive infection C-terminus